MNNNEEGIDIRDGLPPPIKERKNRTKLLAIIIVVLLIGLLIFHLIANSMGGVFTYSVCSLDTGFRANITEAELIENMTEWDYRPIVKERRADATDIFFRPWCGEMGSSKQAESRAFIEKAIVTWTILTEHHEELKIPNLQVHVESRHFRGTNWDDGEMQMINCMWDAIQDHFINISIMRGSGGGHNGCKAVENVVCPSYTLMTMMASTVTVYKFKRYGRVKN